MRLISSEQYVCSALRLVSKKNGSINECKTSSKMQKEFASS